MDAAFDEVRAAAHEGDFERFVTLLEATPELITATSADRGDSPNLIQFIIVDGGLGTIQGPARFLSYLITNGSTTDRQLVAAASVNARELVDVLLEAGCPVDEGERWTAVDESLYWGHTAMAEYLIGDRGAKITSLCSAAALGRVDLVETFLEAGSRRDGVLPVHFPWGPLPDSTLDDAIGQAFILAVRHRQFAVGEYLLDAGMDINAIPQGHHEESTALHQAAGADDIEMADWLIDRGAHATVPDKRFDATATQWAAHEGHTHMEAHLKQRLG